MCTHIKFMYINQKEYIYIYIYVRGCVYECSIPWCRSLWLRLMTTSAQTTVLMNHPISYRTFSTPSVSHFSKTTDFKVRWMQRPFVKLWSYQTMWSNKLMVTSRTLRSLMELSSHWMRFLSLKMSPCFSWTPSPGAFWIRFHINKIIYISIYIYMRFISIIYVCMHACWRKHIL